MRRKYISPEYEYIKTKGSFNVKEERAISGSKLLSVDDYILLGNTDIIFYHNSDNEQLDYLQESQLPPMIYSTVNDKEENHNLYIEESQTDFEKQKNTKWKLEINIQSILVNYIFSKLKENRTFEKIENDATLYNSVDVAIRKYIEDNILFRYKYEEITLYIRYNDLDDSGEYRYKNTWDYNINNDNNIESKIGMVLNADKSKLIGSFAQEKTSDNFNFNYYFDVKYSKK